MVDVRGKVAVITGASRGLGAGLARAFAAGGLALGLCARHCPTAPPAVDSVTRGVDVTDAAAMAAFADAVVATLGPIDLWINNAGVIDPVKPLREIDPGGFAHVLAINVLGVVHGTQVYVHHRRRVGGGGVLINISSGAAQNAYAGWSAYCASKAAVDRFSEAVALEEADTPLRVHAVAPGVVDTDMQRRIRGATVEQFPAVAKFHQLKAEGRFNSPDHVARELLAMAFDPRRRPDQVVVRVADQGSG